MHTPRKELHKDMNMEVGRVMGTTSESVCHKGCTSDYKNKWSDELHFVFLLRLPLKSSTMLYTEMKVANIAMYLKLRQALIMSLEY